MDAAVAYGQPPFHISTQRVLDALKSKLDFKDLHYAIETLEIDDEIIGESITLNKGSAVLGKVEVGWASKDRCLYFHANSPFGAAVPGGLDKLPILEVVPLFNYFVIISAANSPRSIMPIKASRNWFPNKPCTMCG